MENTTYIRQQEIFEPRNFEKHNIAIIGCGSIGSFIGLTLAKIGLKNFFLCDNDKIEEHNIPNQFFKRKQINTLKTIALAEIMTEFGSNEPQITHKPKKFTTKNELKGIDIIFSCPDTMKARKDILKIAKRDKVKLLIDTRMAGQIFEVFTVNLTKKVDIAVYKDSLFEDKHAEPTRCGEQSIIYNVLAVSSIAVANLIKIFNNKPYKQYIGGDLINMEIK